MSSAAIKIVNDLTGRISARFPQPLNIQNIPIGAGLVPGKIHQIYGGTRTGVTAFGNKVLGRNGYGSIMDEANFMGPVLPLKCGTKVCWNSPDHGRLTGVVAFTSPKRGRYYNLRLDEGIKKEAHSAETIIVDSIAPGQDAADFEPIVVDFPRSITYAVQARSEQVRRMDAIELLGALSES